MPHEAEPLHRLLVEIGLRAGGPFGFALAGGHAVAAHGIIDRPSEDVDLFADWQRRADFPTAVDAVIAAYEGEGFDVVVDLRLNTFARLHISQAAGPDQPHRVELVANWRAQPPVEMQIGLVLHPDDVMAGKVDALYNRAAARDFIDIDAAITRGRYTSEQLCTLASKADAGFDRRFFAQMLGMIDYGLESAQVARCVSVSESGRATFSYHQAEAVELAHDAAPRTPHPRVNPYRNAHESAGSFVVVAARNDRDLFRFDRVYQPVFVVDAT